MGDKIKNIPEQKLKAFSIGTMGKRSLSKKELEEQRKKEEERAAAHVFEEFVATFQESPISSSSKVWVKAGTYDAGARKEDTKDKGKLYKPQSRIPSTELMASTEKAQFYAKLISDKKPERLGKKETTY
jgi:U2-associated protein SR140